MPHFGVQMSRWSDGYTPSALMVKQGLRKTQRNQGCWRIERVERLTAFVPK